MRVTTKGQVTIPQHIREKLGITLVREVGFVEEKGRVYLVRKEGRKVATRKFRRLKEILTVKMTRNEIIVRRREDK